MTRPRRACWYRGRGMIKRAPGLFWLNADKLVSFQALHGTSRYSPRWKGLLVLFMTDLDRPKLWRVHASMVRMLFPQFMAPADLLPPSRCSEASKWRFAANSPSIQSATRKKGPIGKKRGSACQPMPPETLNQVLHKLAWVGVGN
jgi:hypothetical protein